MRTEEELAPTGEDAEPIRPRGRGRRALVWTAATLLVLVAAMAPLAYLTFLRPPALDPQDFLDGDRSGDGPVVVIAGASSVHGIGSADFVGLLRDRFAADGHTFVNAGSNGDTAADLLARADDIVAVNPDRAAVLVGTNNVLAAADGDEETALADYRRDLEALIARLDTETRAEIALYSLQPLGEDLDDDGNRRLGRFNQVVAEVALAHGAAYLPLNETLAETVRAEGGSQPSDFSLGSAALAGLRHYYLGQNWDEIGRSNGYRVLVDGVHLNDRGAAVAADLAENWLRAT
ncbi:GDSL-type esterase/lipase family protein [Phytomonospora sp. NPDC050363]|uniref:SGNH/GDSL hydrolase family protein n=1 Tax=Phytomonospora sp. NPDC050363 TaxID=3155642 RepID=UPI0033F47426